jgi:hypothetical protein
MFPSKQYQQCTSKWTEINTLRRGQGVARAQKAQSPQQQVPTHDVAAVYSSSFKGEGGGEPLRDINDGLAR